MTTRRNRSNSIANGAAAHGVNDLGKIEAPAGKMRSTSKPARSHSRNSNRDNTTSRLRELPRIPPRPTTPIRRVSSADVIPGQLSTRRTPGGPTSLRKATGNTPHAMAAMREIELRRAAVLTPGRNRRKSLLVRQQQEVTPMAQLRTLSKLLAPTTKPPTPSPPDAEPSASKGTKRRRIPDDFDDLDEEVPARPRLSMPLGDYEEDDSLILPPPSSSGLDDENFTARSIEVPRRVAIEQVGSRLSRGSFGSDDRMEAFGTFNFNAMREEGIDSSFIPQDDYRDETEDNRRYSGIPREDTGTVQFDVPGEVSRRISDLRRTGPHNEDSDISFRIAVPFRDDVPENMLNHGNQEMEDLPFDAVEDTPVAQQNGGSEMFGAISDDPNLAAEEDEEGEGEDEDLADENEEDSAQYGNDTLMTEDNQDGTTVLPAATTSKRRKKPIKLSEDGTPISSLPMGLVKKLATTYARTSGNSKAKLNKDALAAIMQASDWFFEQVSEDLGAYSEHAKRRTIDESDVITLMKRQRQVNATTTPFALAQKYLPRELLQDLRMAIPSKLGKKRPAVLEEEEEEEGEEA